jgi:predicted ATPase/DNA-binding SARP family transcriptional activator
MDSLRANLFGFPQITLNGKAIQPERRKTLAVLVYLLSSGEAYSRENLAVLFWAEQDSQQALASLRNVLWEIRRLLGENWLELEGKTVRLRLDLGACVDTRRFESLVDESNPSINQLQEAADLYRGDFLAGFTLKDSYEFDDWQTSQAEHLRRLRDRALEKLARSYAANGELDAAVAAARRRVEVDQLNEEAQRILVELLARSGQRSAAIRQFEVCQKALKDELDIEPSAETFEIYRQVCAAEFKAPEAAPAAPPLRPARTSNLPAPAVPLIGRTDELQQVSNMLADPTCRLLSIIGPGGAGKTSLALQAARQNQHLFADGAWFVPLAPVKSKTGMLTAIMETLKIPQPGMGSVPMLDDLQTQIGGYLQNKQLLLVVDNLEHLIEDVLVLSELLSKAPGLKLLATSRERLNLAGEWVLEIAGLPVPGFHTSGRSEEYDSVQLFLAAAKRVRAGFAPVDEDWLAIERICQQVDGLPLGLELAASWLRTLSCAEIVSEMERTLDFLYSTQRGVPERQRSLRAAFDYSWALLDESERVALRRLSVFEGGFTRQAAAQVAGVSLQVLSSLVDKSLLERSEESRYDLHAVLKQYTHEAQAAFPVDLKQLRDWHSGYYLDQLSDWFEDFKGNQQHQAISKFAAEQANLFSAWSWAMEQKKVDLIRKSCTSLVIVMVMHGQRGEALTLLEPAVQLAEQLGDQTLQVFTLAAIRYFYRGNPALGEIYIKKSLELLQQIDNSREKAYAQILLSTSAVTLLYAQKHDLCRQSTEYLHATGDDYGAGIATLVLADTLCMDAHNYEVAEEAYQLSRLFFDAMDNDWGRGLCQTGLAMVARGKQQYDQATQLLQTSLAIAKQLGNPVRIIEIKQLLGEVLLEAGKLDQARLVLESNLPTLEELGWKNRITWHKQLIQKTLANPAD